MLNTLVGGIASLIVNFGQEKKEFQIKFRKVGEMLQFKKITGELNDKVLRYVRYYLFNDITRIQVSIR
jgi:hypothetical protein